MQNETTEPEDSTAVGGRLKRLVMRGGAQHFEDKVRVCDGCGSEVLIKHNQVGGFWYLSGFVSDSGSKVFGGYCPECFDKIKG